MKKQRIIGVASAVVLGGCGIGAIAANSAVNAENVKADAQIAASDLIGSDNTIADETIYVFTGADGKVQKTIDSIWEKNSLGEDSYSKLTTNIDVPVTMNVTYKLDGKEISAKDLVGKSGKVTIKIKYTNNAKQSNGIYMPYAVVSGTILDGAKFKNVSVKNGKAMNDGNKIIVTSVALPGMNESLGVYNVLPDTVEVIADVTDFEMGMMMSIATSEIFSDVDTTELDSIDALTSKLSELTSGVQKLSDGAKSLKSGAGELTSGARKLDEGIGSLQSGVGELGKKLDGASEKSDELRGRMETIVGKVLTAANTEFRATVKAGIKQMIAANYPTLTEEQVEAQANAQMATIPDLTLENYVTVFENLKMDYPAFTTAIENTAAQFELLEKFHDGLIAYTEGMDLAAETVNGDLKDGVDALKNGSAALVEGAEKLTDGAGQLSDGVETLASGVQMAVSKIEDVENVLDRAKLMFNAAKGGKNIKYIYRSVELKH